MKCNLMMRTLGCVVILVCVSLPWSSACPKAEPVPNELPRSWKMEDIAKEALPNGDGRVYVLAWTIVEDDRPLRVERCLVLTGGGKLKGWSLTRFYRHPSDKKPCWELSMVHVTESIKPPRGRWITHSKWFKDRPKNKEIYASLDAVGWSFEQEKGWKFVACCVCEKSWQAGVGEAPTRFFGK